MKRVRRVAAIGAVASTLLVSMAVVLPTHAATTTSTHLRPAVLDADMPDPALASAQGRFFVFSTGSGGRELTRRSSVDKLHWSTATDPLASLPEWGARGRTWAPAIARVEGQWILLAAVLHRQLGVQCVAAFRATSITDKFVPIGGPLTCGTTGRGAIDPDLVIDGDAIYLLWKEVGRHSPQIVGARIAVDISRVTTSVRPLLSATRSWEGGGVENPALVRTSQGWRLFYSANWWTDGRYATGFARCSGPLGPCSTTGTPFLSSSRGPVGPGGLSIATGPDGRRWAAFHSWSGGVARDGGHRKLHLEPIDATRPRFVSASPRGRLDIVHRAAGGVYAAGRASDADTGRAVEVAVLVDGDRRSTSRASLANHGFFDVARSSAGKHRVCVVALDDAGGPSTTLKCVSMSLRGTPFGTVSDPQLYLQGTRLTGMAIDPDTSRSIRIRVRVDGRRVRVAKANLRRDDVARNHRTYGPMHGFDVSIPLKTGKHQVCVDGLDSHSGAGKLIRCVTVTKHLPV